MCPRILQGRLPTVFRTVVQVSRQEGTDHRAGESEERTGADDIPDHRCGKGGGNTIPRAAENRKKDIDHVLERESTGHSQRKEKTGERRTPAAVRRAAKIHFRKEERLSFSNIINSFVRKYVFCRCFFHHSTRRNGIYMERYNLNRQ